MHLSIWARVRGNYELIVSNAKNYENANNHAYKIVAE